MGFPCMHGPSQPLTATPSFMGKKPVLLFHETSSLNLLFCIEYLYIGLHGGMHDSLTKSHAANNIVHYKYPWNASCALCNICQSNLKR